MIVRDFDDMRIGTIPLSKLYYGHDLIWKREDGGGVIIDKKMDSLYLSNNAITCMDISPDGRFIVAGIESLSDGREDNMFIIQVLDGKLYIKQRIRRASRHLSIAFSKNGEYLFCRCMSNTGSGMSSFVYKITDTSFVEDEIMRIKLNSALEDTDRFSFSKDGNYLISKNYWKIRFIKYNNGEFTLLNEEIPRVVTSGVYPSNDSICVSTDGVYGVITLYNPYSGLGDVYKRMGENYSFYTTLKTSSNVKSSCCSFSPNDKFLAFGRDTAYTNDALLVIFKNDNGIFTRITSIDVLPVTSVRNITFSNDSKYMYVLVLGTPFIIIYKIDGETFKKMPDPIDLPESSASRVKISLDDKYVAILGKYAELYETTQ